ncbi:MAG: ATP-binding cassette domain-containing protein [Clostridia bacterium]|nr:ATP-binding cassette domain-containing protein [Clostridia bacterium]
MIELINVSYSATNEQGTKDIIKNVSLTLDGKLIAFTGPNGGGKSTLAKLIMGILSPTSGKILLDGEDITNLSITERANKGVAFAFQQPVRFKGITVSDLVNLASGKKLTVTEVCSYLSEVGLCAREYVNREINSSLSGGELKRIEIASTMARNAKFTLFDEPEAGIDLWSFSSLIKVFERLANKTDGTLLIISHQERILNIAERIIVIENGTVKADGSKDEVLPKILSGATCSALSSKGVN